MLVRAAAGAGAVFVASGAMFVASGAVFVASRAVFAGEPGWGHLGGVRGRSRLPSPQGAAVFPSLG